MYHRACGAANLDAIELPRSSLPSCLQLAQQDGRLHRPDLPGLLPAAHVFGHHRAHPQLLQASRGRHPQVVSRGAGGLQGVEGTVCVGVGVFLRWWLESVHPRRRLHAMQQSTCGPACVLRRFFDWSHVEPVAPCITTADGKLAVDFIARCGAASPARACSGTRRREVQG